ncbi:MAG: hypothetical protein IJV48_08610 [Ruminococcus sp.]|nr:hypothetical protein [Ruminococcus sp.]
MFLDKRLCGRFLFYVESCTGFLPDLLAFAPGSLYPLCRALVKIIDLFLRLLDRLLSFPKDTIYKFRQGKVIPSRLELARICIALELTELAVKQLFKAFRYDYDAGYDQDNQYMIIAALFNIRTTAQIAPSQLNRNLK